MPWPFRVLRLLAEPMSLLLVVAAAVDGLGLGEPVDAAAILAIAALNTAIAFFQEGKAASALEALKSLESPRARVVRNGVPVVVPAREVVPDDVLVLAAGDRVAADARLADAQFLEVDESLLTGESLPVQKDAGAELTPDDDLADRIDMVFAGTVVTRGSGRAAVTATGRGTRMGAIAARLSEREPRTPLQGELRSLTFWLGAVAVLAAAAVFVLTLVRMGLTSQSLERSFLAAVALAVAAVPEGLATVVTVALALGVRRMASRGAIVRRLAAVETLGAATVILTDKTGTLTENTMRVESVDVDGRSFDSLASLGSPLGERIVEAASLCNDATLDPNTGDPLDVALLEAVGSDRVADLRARFPRVAGFPFESEHRRMTTVHRTADESVLVLMKGAPEAVVERCSTVAVVDEGSRVLDDAERDRLLRVSDAVARRGMRTLALAGGRRFADTQDLREAEDGLELLGVVGLRDPVRPQAPGAVREAQGAGIQIAMVTGDHAGTAAAVADEVGLAGSDRGVVTGSDLRRGGAPKDPLSVPVYARVDPDEKLGLVEALQARGHVVAVTGDGVNDAPALRRADIGVAMGRRGTDVAREASDMVISDDNLATIVEAVREGRGIYDNIRKVVDYLVGGNLSEITVVVATLLLFPALGVPLLPLQLLWINLLTDGPPAIALAVDTFDPALMRRPPRPKQDRMLSSGRLLTLIGRGALMASASVGALAVARFVWHEPWSHARAMMFTALVTAHLLYAFAVRWPEGAPLSLRRLVSNLWLLAGVGLGIALQICAVTWPPARSVLGTASLSLREWLLVAAAGTVPVALMLAAGRGSHDMGRTSRGMARSSGP